MSTETPNNKLLSIIEFQRMFAGAKSMAIIGSSSSVHQWENGDFIDSHDIVVRFNRTTVNGMEKLVGTRTDIIVANDANRLSKAPSPEFASKPQCVVTFINTQGVGKRSEEQLNGFLEWVARTPLLWCAGPEILCCDVPMRRRGFSMGTYALHALPFFLSIEKLFVTGFTMFGESEGGSDHHTKKSNRATVTWHDADLERYIAANVLGHHTCELIVTDEVAEFMEREGFKANRLGGKTGEKRRKPNHGATAIWYSMGRLAKLLITTGYHIRRVAEKHIYHQRARR